jgi:hypothetical protein
VNNITSQFKHNDALRTLSLRQDINSFLAEEADSHYRTALEISRNGELQIIIPSLEAGKTDSMKNISRNCPPEVIARYDKLVKHYNHFSAAVRDYGQDTSTGADGIENNDSNKGSTLIQIKIVYRINKPVTRSIGGFVFRTSPSSSKVFENLFGTTSNSVVSDVAKCIYSTSYKYGELRDVDGIRCWLPCLDHSDQRYVFDISLSVPKDCSVISVGERISISSGGNKLSEKKTVF